jgi:hypothetical protein
MALSIEKNGPSVGGALNMKDMNVVYLLQRD